ncbi:cyclohexanone monooxygenase [Hyaloraphidium curvatum]|nr:cyclohexanone monooxygenase [Hyaloraphidium curvatum]
MAAKVHDVVVVGSGFSGLYLIRRLRDFLNLDVACFELSDRPGGTWNHNRYPGARVDVRSAEYSYSFDKDLQQEWTWKERFAPQPELMTYIDHVVERFGLARSIQFNSRVKSCAWNEDEKCWDITVSHRETGERSIGDLLGKDGGEQRVGHYKSSFLILATGCLSAPNLPKWPGFETYKGRIFHTARWPVEKVSFEGEKVAVIGTGSSGNQTITAIAKETAALTVFQRTPCYSIPAHNRQLSLEEVAEDKAHYDELRSEALRRPACVVQGFMIPTKRMNEMTSEEIEALLEEQWRFGGLGFGRIATDIVASQEANDVVKAFVHRKIRSIVQDPATAELLCPDFPIGCKRSCIDVGYYQTYNLPQVKLVSVKDNPIKKVGGPDGMVTLANGDRYGPFDSIICATGFDAMTGSVLRMDIVGRNGVTMKDRWAEGPKTILGSMVDGFPNLFLISGPGSPSVLTNMVISLEQMVEYTTDVIAWMRKEGIKTLDPLPETVDAWVTHNNNLGKGTLFSHGCASWYVGANIPGKPRVLMPYIGGFTAYRKACNDLLADGFPGFALGK